MINYYVLISVVAKLTLELVLATYVLPRQLHEALRRKDQFTHLRWYIFWVKLFIFLLVIPIMGYQILYMLHTSSGFSVTNVAQLLGGFFYLGMGYILYSIYNYKYEE